MRPFRKFRFDARPPRQNAATRWVAPLLSLSLSLSLGLSLRASLGLSLRASLARWVAIGLAMGLLAGSDPAGSDRVAAQTIIHSHPRSVISFPSSSVSGTLGSGNGSPVIIHSNGAPVGPPSARVVSGGREFPSGPSSRFGSAQPASYPSSYPTSYPSSGSPTITSSTGSPDPFDPTPANGTGPNNRPGSNNRSGSANHGGFANSMGPTHSMGIVFRDPVARGELNSHRDPVVRTLVSPPSMTTYSNSLGSPSVSPVAAAFPATNVSPTFASQPYASQPYAASSFPTHSASGHSATRYPINESRTVYFDRNDYRDSSGFGDSPVRLDGRYDPAVIDSARNAADRFRNQALSLPVAIAGIAEGTADFTDHWADLAEKLSTLNGRVQDANEQFHSTARDFDDVSAKIEDYGLTPTIGWLLRNKKEQLDQWQARDSQTLFASQEIGRSRQEQLELEMVRFDGSDVPSQSDELLREAGIDSRAVANQALTRQIAELLQQRRGWLNRLSQGYQDYQQKLGELDSITTASTQLSEDYRALIDQHVTWIRSGEPIHVSDLGRLQSGIAAFFSTRRSGEFGFAVEQKWKANPASAIGLIVSLIVIALARWRAKVWLLGIGERKRLRAVTADTRKVLASFLTVLVSIGIPGMLYCIARWLEGGVVSESTLHAASGCYAASLVALMVEVPRQVLRKFGYVDQHIDGELPRRDRATTYLTLIGFGLVLAAYVITFSGLFDRGMWRDSLSRFGFILAMLLVAWTAHLSLRPKGGFLEPLIARLGGSVIHRVRLVIYLVGIGFPMAMIAASALGYGYTANELIKRAIITLVSLTIAATLWGGIKILSAMAWKSLAGSSDTRRGPGGSRSSRRFDDPEPNVEVTGVLGEHYLELKHHLAFLCQCGLVIAGIVGVGWLWLDIIPHAGMGNPVVWTIQESVATTQLSSTGQRIAGSTIQETPVTAMHLALAAATLFVAFQLAKLLPAMFDALVLQRVSFDEGMEHFSLVLGRFLLFGVGCLIACQWIGVRWQTTQWLAVGLTIGLGFGLQDMVRNLFGGLIVLFEKPARLGDFITVGNVTGRVSAQRLRTTVLSDDEGREVIVPNKSFVNEDVTNWMGAGRLRVIPIEVAVTRDQRPADICRTLQELALDQDAVLLTPAPHATLVCVGKRTQRIEVRAWIEESRDAERYRDAFLKVVRRFLHDKNWLAHEQPPQPDMNATSRTPPSRRLKRSA